MASSASAATNLEWLQGQGIEVSDKDVYVAPMYGPTIDDEQLLAQIRKRRPSHIIVTIGGGSTGEARSLFEAKARSSTRYSLRWSGDRILER